MHRQGDSVDADLTLSTVRARAGVFGKDRGTQVKFGRVDRIATINEPLKYGALPFRRLDRMRLEKFLSRPIEHTAAP